MMRWTFEVNGRPVEVLANKLPTALKEVGQQALPDLVKAGGYNSGLTIKLLKGEPVAQVKTPPLEAPPPPEGMKTLPPLPPTPLQDSGALPPNWVRRMDNEA